MQTNMRKNNLIINQDTINKIPNPRLSKKLITLLKKMLKQYKSKNKTNH